MILLDSNILIYAAQPAYSYLRPLVSNPLHQVFAFTMLEVLGFSSLTAVDKAYFQSVFTILDVIDISLDVINRAIILRQTRKMSPGDAIIAGTALVIGAELYTRNVADFNWISGLTIVNPI